MINVDSYNTSSKWIFKVFIGLKFFEDLKGSRIKPSENYLLLMEIKLYHQDRGVYLLLWSAPGKTFKLASNEMKVITQHNRAVQGQPAKWIRYTF